MVELAVAIAAVMTVVNYVAALVIGLLYARDHQDYSASTAPLSALLTLPASLLWFNVGGFLGLAAGGDGGALAAVVVLALLDGVGLLIAGVIGWDWAQSGSC